MANNKVQTTLSSFFSPKPPPPAAAFSSSAVAAVVADRTEPTLIPKALAAFRSSPRKRQAAMEVATGTATAMEETEETATKRPKLSHEHLANDDSSYEKKKKKREEEELLVALLRRSSRSTRARKQIVDASDDDDDDDDNDDDDENENENKNGKDDFVPQNTFPSKKAKEKVNPFARKKDTPSKQPPPSLSNDDRTPQDVAECRSPLRVSRTMLQRFSRPKEGADNATVDSADGASAISESVSKARSMLNIGHSLASSKASFVLKPDVKYTPLERQVLDLKQQRPDALLAVECGYRYRFFGDDAEVAGNILGMVVYQDHNFLTCSIPTNRIQIHTRRLVANGYKVAVVNQTETAALKAVSATKSAPFGREITALYTSSTFMEESVDAGSTCDEESAVSLALAPFLLTIFETASATNPDSAIFGIVAVQPSTGDMIYDEFEDGRFRAELETRLLHVQPKELLVPETLSPSTEKIIRYVIDRCPSGDGIRVERSKANFLGHNEAFAFVSKFYADLAKDGTVHRESAVSNLAAVGHFPKNVTVALAALIKYLQDFQLARVLKLTKYFSHFSSKNCMLLNGNTLKNLEILQNETDFSVKGSLLWILDHTLTAAGKRLLKKWVTKPLVDKAQIDERLLAVSELLGNTQQWLTTLRDLLKGLPDLEKALTKVHYNRCTPKELLQTLNAFGRVVDSFPASFVPTVESSLIKEAFASFPTIAKEVRHFRSMLNEAAANKNEKENVFMSLDDFPKILRCKQDIAKVEADLDEHLVEVRDLLKMKQLRYTSVSGEEFLIELDNKLAAKAPPNWVKVSGTKQVSRFHTPLIAEKLKEQARNRERLSLEAKAAFVEFLQQIAEHYETFRDVVRHLSTLDCLNSLAIAAAQPGYVMPKILPRRRSDDAEDGGDARPQIIVKQGRHPMVEALLTTGFVPNDINLHGDGRRCLIITGPNMGGKSSYIRQVALIALMAHIGSYVPAESAEIGLLDAIYTRMGASDDITRGRSTFMTELQETSDIMKQATDRSLVILDELGRGTSTHDGVAIAYATLQYFVAEVKSLTLFVTHYPSLSKLQTFFPKTVGNYHMSFISPSDNASEGDNGEGDDPEVITFLYKLVEKAASRSYGLNVAKLASLPEEVIANARTKSAELERLISARAADAQAERRSSLVALYTQVLGGFLRAPERADAAELMEAICDVKELFATSV